MITFAQDRFTYVITDVQKNSANWTSLRKLDLKTGSYSDVLFNGVDPAQVAYDAATRKPILNSSNNEYGNYIQNAFSTGVAAIAYDKRNNRIYFTPMFVDQLRYIDLKTMKVFYVADQPFTKLGSLHNDEAKIVTRMVIGDDGYGYAITNDANTFIRFSTNKKTKIEVLGSLVDDPSNTGISIHNRCSSWGGDMISDDDGNLYVFSANNNVFKINIETKVATWLGPVKNLPGGFTTNGVVVSDDGKLLAGSQVYADSWVVIDPSTWSASPFLTKGGAYLTSDLANSNVLKTHAPQKAEVPVMIVKAETATYPNIQLYPNPVTTGVFRIQFIAAGDYTVQLSDVSGKLVQSQKINVGSEGQLQSININRNTAKGIYLVKVSDITGKSVFTQKLVVQ
jgi:hypothetical protein